MKILVTGGSGFIGSAFIRFILSHTKHHILNIDKLTYAADPRSLAKFEHDPRYLFAKIDLNDLNLLRRCYERFQPNAVVHFAAESHVDRSIVGPQAFVETNIIGTFSLLEVSRSYWEGLSSSQQSKFRFIHVSTDEVYGDAYSGRRPFTEQDAYRPSSPYAASKASADQIVYAWHKTYDLPILITHSTNNYGPYQHTEKFIPKVIDHILKAEAIPIYGDGLQKRDWLFVEDHVGALNLILDKGKVGESYNIGTQILMSNIEIVSEIYTAIKKLAIDENFQVADLDSLIKYTKDRLGHDRCYAVDTTKITNQLRWKPEISLRDGLLQTIKWHIKNLEQ